MIDAIDRPHSIFKQAVASNGTQFFAVWSEVQGSTVGDIHGTRITRDGTALDSTGFKIISNQELGGILYDGMQYLIFTRTSPSQISITTVSVSGEVGKTSLITDNTVYHGLPAVANRAQGISCITYAGWFDSIGTSPANTWRIKGRIFNSEVTSINPFPTAPTNAGISITTHPHRQILIVKFTPGQNSINQSYMQFSIILYNSKGQSIVSWNDCLGNKNYHTYNLKSTKRHRLPAGTYFVKVSTGNTSLFKKIVLF